MNFKKEELQEMIQTQLEGVKIWQDINHANALTIKSQHDRIIELEAKVSNLARRIQYLKMGSEEMN
jgi:hypothetical protein|tara:strand:+ start:333 stop:530 length:198 start_codon:yes stop_codon:yes gene_type:complete